MLSVSFLKLMSQLKGLQDKMGLWFMVALCILALLGSSVYFLVKSLIPSLPETIEIGEADPLHTSLTPYEKFCYAMLQFAERCIGK